MKVSIIIPIYNVSPYIERCLQSALNQTYKEIEYVCVNDGSTDDSFEKAKKIIASNSREDQVVLVEHKKNEGIAITRNTGIEHSTGEYIYFLDSDDELPLNAIEILVAANDGIAADIVLGDFDITGGRREEYVKIKKSDTIIGKEKILNSFLSLQWYDGTCNKMVKRSFLEENGISFRRGIIHEDILWSFEIAMYASCLIFLNRKTYIYHIRPNSITQKVSDKNFRSLLFVMKEMVELSTKNNLYSSQPELFNYFSNIKIYFLKELVRSKASVEYIKKSRTEVNHIFSNKIFNSLGNYSFASILKILPYKLPIHLSILYIKVILWPKRG